MEPFLREKFKLKALMMTLLKDLQTPYGIIVKLCARKTKAFKSLCKQERVEIKFEYTVPNKPQQNATLNGN